MKKFDIVRIINAEAYQEFDLTNDMHGIVVEKGEHGLRVLVFYPENQGACAMIDISADDVVPENEKLPENLQKELEKKLDILYTKPHKFYRRTQIKEFDIVELLVEREDLAQMGIHKGETGCVISEYAIENKVEVDFSGIDENGNFYGDCVSVKIDDLKLIKKAATKL